MKHHTRLMFEVYGMIALSLVIIGLCILRVVGII